MKKSLKNLKSKFGQFELSNEQVKNVKGGYKGCVKGDNLIFGLDTCPAGYTEIEVSH